ncbi:hypothetical protein PpBr36_08575 [Pyricularia pennisetigena]|uniref:hypothetical protein n=1 Tax=Pyricularia pennisetigena TaxID=1578925 RepID=UPI0011502CF7|nr:hypothetical protein PpBr36_08575 [Pyricularia pennisetigena]TLS23856.1 hypothetical protein PpBr36_08575 [Pyricularia pennisetigena]
MEYGDGNATRDDCIAMIRLLVKPDCGVAARDGSDGDGAGISARLVLLCPVGQRQIEACFRLKSMWAGARLEIPEEAMISVFEMSNGQKHAPAFQH